MADDALKTQPEDAGSSGPSRPRPCDDVLVVGAGPAGMLAAAALARAGLQVALVAPEPGRRWPNTYGCWVDDVADAELAGAMASTWERVRVTHVHPTAVHRGYGCVDNQGWQEILAGRCAAAGVRVVRGAVRAVRHREDRSIVTLDAGERAARLVVDASGATGLATERQGAPTLFQVAWGEVVEADGYDGEMRWMDFGEQGSFLYAMPFGDRVFVEETELATRTVALDPLRERLHRRLADAGVRVRRTLAVERCVIPLDVPASRPERVLPFGASAGMVQPSTGYLLTRLVRDAPTLAAALAGTLDRPPAEAVDAAWRAIWPAHRVRQRTIHAWGASIVASMDPGELRAFFAEFFRLPPPVQRAWLADALPPGELLSAMAQMYGGLPPRLWRQVGAGAACVLAALATSLLESR